MKKLSKAILFALTIVGFVYGFKLSYHTWTKISPCPSLGIVPACYLVTIGYFLMSLSLVSSKVNFYIGWVLVFVLALVGSTLEVFVHNICPSLGNGFPMCYISLSISILLLLFYRLSLKSKNGSQG